MAHKLNCFTQYRQGCSVSVCFNHKLKDEKKNTNNVNSSLTYYYATSADIGLFNKRLE
jgi:hypothetical protein